MANDLDKLSKWRIEQFRRNNKEDRSPEKDFVCLSPIAFQDDPNLMFLSDSEEENRPVTLETDGLVVVKAASGGRKRKRPNTVYTELSDGSDDDVVVNKRRTRQSTMKSTNSVKALPFKPILVSKRTAVVMPITKANPHIDDTELGIIKVNPKISNVDSAAKAVNQSHRRNSLEKLEDSDSDLSLFEVSFHNKPSKVAGLNNEVIRDPPPSPIDITNGSNYGQTDVLQCSPSPTSFVVNSMDNGFSSDDSSDTPKKKRGGKGKQPANKRRKVVTKTSKPATDNIEDAKKDEDPPLTVGEDLIVLESQGSDMRMDSQADNAKSVSPPKPIESNESAEHVTSKLEERVRCSEEKVNKAVVKPNSNSSVIVIGDDDDDDVVMLTNSEKSKQELDDLEYARRLQAQFDEEQTRGNGAYGPLPDPRLADPERGNTSARRVTFADSPLPERSERLLQAVGASPALTQFLGSPRSTQAGASLTELANVEQRLELLRQLALQNEFIDDAVITEILGVPTPPPEPGSNRGPRPPSQRPSRRESAGTTSRGAVGYQQASNTFQRALLGLGMNAGEDASYESLLELADRIGDARQAGLEPEVIDQLPCRTYKEEEARGGETECRICMSDFEKGQRLRTLNCFHEYHSACIDKWLQRNASCPICRVKVTFD